MDFGRQLIIYKFYVFFLISIQINAKNIHHRYKIQKNCHWLYDDNNNKKSLNKINYNNIKNFNSSETIEKFFNEIIKVGRSNENGHFISIGNNEYLYVPFKASLNDITTSSTKPTKRQDIIESQIIQSQLIHQNDNVHNNIEQEHQQQQQQIQTEQIFPELNSEEIYIPIDNDNNSNSVEDDVGNQYYVIGKYSGSQLWKIHLTDTRHIVVRKLKKYYGGEIWDMNVDGIDMFFESDVNAYKAKSYIDTTEVTYNIMIDDVQAAILDTFKIANLTKEDVPWLRSDDLIMTWDRYQDLDIINEFYYFIVDRFSHISQLLTIGRTHEKRDIKVLKISNGNPNNPAIFVDAGMQAREWIAPAALTLAISRFLYNYNTKPNFMKNVDWYFLPISNPDGYEFTRTEDRLWSKNRRKNRFCEGVNLDRNFNYQWGKKGSVGDPCSLYYRGPERFSEPESTALKNFLLQLGKKIKAYISIGSYGQMITYPWGDDDFVPNTYQEMHLLGKKMIKAIRKATGGEYQIGSSYGLKFARSGNSADWVMDTITPKYVFNVYLRDQGRYGYLIPPNFIVQSGFDIYEILKTTAQNIPDNAQKY